MYIALVQKYTMPKIECLFYIQMYLIKCQRLNISAKACFMSSIVNSEDRMNVYLYMTFYAVVNWVQ